jgi:hypothetical protein
VTPEWAGQAVCRGLSTKSADMAFGYLQTQRKFAATWCSACPVVVECREYGGDWPGVYGGMTQQERVQLRPEVVDEAHCGKPRGFRRHQRRGEPICDACRDARRAQDRANYARRGAA